MGKMTITSGVWKGRAIETPEGTGTRPLLTRLRKSLVDILRPRLSGARVLDLFGGSGAVTFELLSNGAREAVVVELDPPTARLIERNADRLGARVEVHSGDALQTLPYLARRGERFDVVVVAPPYGRCLGQAALDVLEGTPALAPGGVVVVQRDGREPAARAGGHLALVRTRGYGRTSFDFYEEAGG